MQFLALNPRISYVVKCSEDVWLHELTAEMTVVQNKMITTKKRKKKNTDKKEKKQEASLCPQSLVMRCHVV